MLELEAGTVVTVIAESDPTFTIVKRVTSAQRHPAVGFLADIENNVSNPGSRFYQYAHEGVTWIRGVHPPASREAKALVAAYALVLA